MHPYQALRMYRRQVNPNARMAVIAMTPKRSTLADPQDSGVLAVAGFDSDVPQLLTEFSAGRI
jgi:60 kDa SS-A/Ro ribonucleoprotein